MDPAGKANEHELIFKQLQSRPLYLTAGVGKSTVELDLMASGRIRLAVTDIPNSVTVADEEVKVSIVVASYPDGIRYYELGPVPPSAEPPRDGWPLPLPPANHNIAAAMQRPADLPCAWWVPPRNYSVTVQLSFHRTKMNDFNAPQIQTKPVPFALKLTPGGTAIFTVSVPGDPLDKRVESAVKEFEKNYYQAKLGPVPEIGPTILKTVADGIELNVALAMEETAVAR